MVSLKEDSRMILHKQAAQAFKKAIESVGLESFKKSSLFMSNHQEHDQVVLDKAA